MVYCARLAPHVLLRAALMCLVALWLIVVPGAARAQLANSCNAATTQGAAPADFQSYCWLDFTGYSDVTARTAGGQAFGWNLPDGTRVTATVRASSGAVVASLSPAWTGANFGNSFGGFSGIAGRPIMYTSAAGAATFVLSSITVTPPTGVGATAYMFVVADAESTDGAENIQMVSNGSAWTQLSLLDGTGPTPTLTNAGTTMTINGNAGTSPGDNYIFGSTTPTQVTVNMAAGGLQGVAVAIRFASLRLNKQIVGTRLNAADQFTYRVVATTGGTTLASGTTTGTGSGPFTAATVSLASGLAMSLTEAMATGSVSALSAYSARLTCTNATTGSSTPLPNNVAIATGSGTGSYSFGTLQYGDSVVCTFTNTPFPTVQLVKALGGAGRVFAADQFIMNVATGATVVATTTTTGAGATVSTGSTPVTLVTPATAYSFAELPSGTTNLNYYTAGLACTNSYTASTTVLPTAVGGSVTPALADKIVCTITNTPKPAKADLVMSKVATLISDPVNGSTNPKMIPGAIVRYLITVTNQGNGPVDNSTTAVPTVSLVDPITGTLGTYVQGTAVVFTNGTPSSTLGCTYATCVSFTKTVGGTTGFGAGTTPDVAGFDDAVTGIRIQPTGTFAAATAAGQPFFTIQFDARIK
jgi:hypothetical protein